ncbi:MAG: GNAT family N-acetyltransferase [Candidatus Babeliales bacterium]
MYRPLIIKITLASLLLSSTQQHAMEHIKPIALGLGAAASLALAYVFATRAEPAIKIVPEHTSGTDTMCPFLKFALYKTADKMLIGSIYASYCISTQKAHIETLRISKQYQKQGYGEQLWNTMIHELKKHAVHTVTWRAVPIDLPPSLVYTPQCQKELNILVAWYEKRGGTVVTRYPAEVDMMLKI